MSSQGWEDSEFPIICETCLGSNPFVRMTKQVYGSECKTCGRPFTIFKWSPGVGMRYKKTEICQTCAKIKNLCQTCILDLEFGQPVQVRDTVLKVNDNIPRSDVNKEYYVECMEKKIKNDPMINYSRAEASVREQLRKMSRMEPHYKRNLPHLCSFYAAGNCKRGDSCPYRHELPVKNDLSHQNIRDRYYGHNDPVAEKLLRRMHGDFPAKKKSDSFSTSVSKKK